MKRLVGTILAYLLWLAASALAVVDLFVARAWWLTVMGAAGMDRWTGGFLDKVLLILCGIGFLTVVITTESYLVNAVGQGKLVRRAARVTGLELLVLAVLQIVTDATAGRLASSALGLALEAGALCGGAVLLAFSLWTRRPGAAP